MLTLEEFTEKYNESAIALLGEPADMAIIRKKYEHYRAIIQFTKSEGDLVFKKRNSREIGITFSPNSPPFGPN
jgi:hypothetical protein